MNFYSIEQSFLFLFLNAQQVNYSKQSKNQCWKGFKTPIEQDRRAKHLKGCLGSIFFIKIYQFLML